MSGEHPILVLKVQADGKEKDAYLDFDFISKNIGMLLPNVQQLGWDLIPSAEEIQASYLDGDGDRCTLTDHTASDALGFATPQSADNTLLLEIQVEDRAQMGKGKAAALPCSTCVNLKGRLAQSKKELARAEESKSCTEQELAASCTALQSEIDSASRLATAAERGAAELQELRADAKRSAEEISRLTAFCDTLRAEVATARRSQAAPIFDNAEVLSAAVSECSPLVLGIEAYEDASRRGDAGQDFKDMAQKLGASQVFRIGRMQLAAGASDGDTKVDSVPASAKIFVINDGAVQWPETAVVVLVKGDSFGVPLLQLGAKCSGETEEIIMDFLVPPRPENTTSCSAWAIVNAATGTPLGPLLVLEAEWRSQ
jgi:hypothetical protein